jgi:hypothetical protein
MAEQLTLNQLVESSSLSRLTTVSRPAAGEAIDAELMLAVYDAVRLARLRYLGIEPIPIPSERALELARRQRNTELVT